MPVLTNAGLISIAVGVLALITTAALLIWTRAALAQAPESWYSAEAAAS